MALVVGAVLAVGAGGWWLARRLEIEVPRWLAPPVVVASVAVTLTVPLFSYVRGGWLTAALAVLTVGGLGCAVLAALWVAALAFTVRDYRAHRDEHVEDVQPEPVPA